MYYLAEGKYAAKYKHFDQCAQQEITAIPLVQIVYVM